jgi:hypothetical protein
VLEQSEMLLVQRSRLADDCWVRLWQAKRPDPSPACCSAAGPLLRSTRQVSGTLRCLYRLYNIGVSSLMPSAGLKMSLVIREPVSKVQARMPITSLQVCIQIICQHSCQHPWPCCGAVKSSITVYCQRNERYNNRPLLEPCRISTPEVANVTQIGRLIMLLCLCRETSYVC